MIHSGNDYSLPPSWCKQIIRAESYSTFTLVFPFPMRTAKLSIPIVLSVFLLGVSLTPAMSSGMQSSAPSNVRNSLPEAEPTNLWQQEAHTPKPEPPIGSRQFVNQAQRNAYAEKGYSPHMPLEELERQHLGYAQSHLIPLPTGVSAVPPPHPNELAAAGTFDSFDTVLTPSHQSIYSEMHIAVEKVMLCNFAPCPQPGSTVDVFVPGGTVSLSNGSKLSFLAGPRPYGLVPHHRYVLFLKHIAEGDFYLLDKSIDVTEGYASPNDPDDVVADQKGTWPFAQMNEPDLLNAVSEKLNAQKAPKP